MFLSNNASIGQMASFFFFSVPNVIAQTVTVAVLLASLITFGSMTRYCEVLAMKANGISLYRASLPIIVIACIICIITFLFSEFIMPSSNQKADYIKYVSVQKRKSLTTFKQNQLWYRGKQGIYNFRIFDTKTNTLKGITINVLDRHSNLIERIDAERAEWKGNRWVCYNVLITRFSADGYPILERVAEQTMDISETPADFMIVQKDADTMGYIELRNYIRKLSADGYDVTRYLTDMYAKISFPFVSVILAVLGISFSLKSDRSGGPMQSIGAGIAIGFSYWIVHALSLSVGRSGTIPPFLAAWLANIIWGTASIVLFIRIRT
jgi:lipopolysaccharide export system permease protein